MKLPLPSAGAPIDFRFGPRGLRTLQKEAA